METDTPAEPAPEPAPEHDPAPVHDASTQISDARPADSMPGDDVARPVADAGDRATRGGFWRRTWVRRSILGVVGVFMALLAVAVLERIVYAGKVMPGVEIAGVDLGGKTEQEAYDELADIAERLETDPLLVEADGNQLTTDPAEFGLDIDVEATLAAVRAAGRSGNPFESIVGTLARRVRDEHVAFPIEIDDEAIDLVVDQWQGSVDEGIVNGSLRFEGTEVIEVPSKAGRAIEIEAARRLVRQELLLVERDVVEIPVSVQDPPVTPEMISATAQRARTILSDDFTLRRDDRTLTIRPDQVAAAMSTRVQNRQLELQIDPGILGAAIGLDLFQIITPATDATFQVTSANTVEVVPSQNGRQLDMPKVIKRILANERTFKAPMRVLRPERDTAWAQSLGIVEQISSYTTYHPPGQSRVTNIHRAADIMNNTVVEPGETFSLNETVGPRTAERGFVSAPVYYEGFTEDFGGGVSQIATTTFNAIFWAGLEDVYHKPHSVYFTRYPMGREATVNYPTVDLKWRNDMTTGVLVRTSYSEESITITLYGTGDGRTVKEVLGDCESTDPATRCMEIVEELPVETLEIDCPPDGEVNERYDPDNRCASLGPGQRLTISEGHTGYRVRYGQLIEIPGQEPRQRTYTWDYVMDPNTVLIGHRTDPPPTTTTTTPTDDTTPTDTAPTDSTETSS